ncbi:hypothetical protein [Streptosporangium carneum]|nr:hypothetical protein [Streptosporangium carneum]
MTVKRRAALAVAAVAAATAMIGATPAHADSLCNVNQNTWVRNAPNGAVLYTIPAGGGFRLLWTEASGWSYGHGNSRPNGYIPAGHLYGCH